MVEKKSLVIFLIGVVALSLVGVVLGYDVRYSEPKNSNGSSIQWEQSLDSLKVDCPREEWNKNFEDYRAGILSKEEMKKYIRGCEW